MKTPRKIVVRWAAIWLVSLASILPFVPMPAVAAPLSFEVLGTHPQAAAQPPGRGQIIHKLEVFDGKLYAGYGDYNGNSGPIDINPFNLSSKTFEGSKLSLATEEINQWRVLNGKLYAPMIDPRCALVCDAGYGVGDSGAWESKIAVQGEHLYDMATLTGTDLWLSGSGAPDGTAWVWRSTDGGSTWNMVHTDTSTNPSGFERYYWLAELNGKMYMQATNTDPATPVRIFDGTNWTEGTTDIIAPSESHGVVFDDKIISTRDGLSAFDGTTRSEVSSFNYSARDMYVDGSYLYILASNGAGQLRVMRTQDLTQWQHLGPVTNQANSIAVHDGTIYVGTIYSQILGSTAVLPQAPTINLASPTANQTVSGQVSIAANIQSEAAIQKVQFKRGNITIKTNNDNTASYTWDTTSVTNGSYEITVVATDALGNVISTSPTTVTVNNAASGGGGSTPAKPSSRQTLRDKARAALSALRLQLVANAANRGSGTVVAQTASANGDTSDQLSLTVPNNKTNSSEKSYKAQSDQSSKKPYVIAGGIALLAAVGIGLYFAFRSRP